MADKDGAMFSANDRRQIAGVAMNVSFPTRRRPCTGRLPHGREDGLPAPRDLAGMPTLIDTTSPLTPPYRRSPFQADIFVARSRVFRGFSPVWKA